MATYTNEDIIRYVEDELSPEEKQKMEEDLRDDPSLAAGVELYRQLKATLQQRLPGEEGEAVLRQTLGGMRSGHFGHGGKVVKMKVRVDVFRKYMVGVAAAAAVLFAVVMLWPSGDFLDKYGRTQMVGTTERGEGNDSLMEQATVYFNNGQFDKALPLLDRVYKGDSANQAALFYRGVAYLHLGSSGDAGKDLEQVFEKGSLFKYEAAFYIALDFAQRGDKGRAIAWLDKIPAGAPVSEKAAQLRKKLE